MSRNCWFHRRDKINPYLAFIILLGAGVIQSALAPTVTINGFQPDWVMVVVLCWSLLRPFEEAILWALGGGVILDLLAATPFGFFTVSLVMVVVMVNFWHDRLSDRALVLPVLLALPYSVLFNLCGLIFLRLMGNPVDWQNVLGKIIFPVALMDVGVMVFIFPLLARFSQLDRKNQLTI